MIFEEILQINNKEKWW